MIQGWAQPLGSAQKVHERFTKHSRTDRSESGRKTSLPLFAVRGRLTRRSELARAMRAARQYPPQDGARHLAIMAIASSAEKHHFA